MRNEIGSSPDFTAVDYGTTRVERTYQFPYQSGSDASRAEPPCQVDGVAATWIAMADPAGTVALSLPSMPIRTVYEQSPLA